jgi:hypothetical protein
LHKIFYIKILFLALCTVKNLLVELKRKNSHAILTGLFLKSSHFKHQLLWHFIPNLNQKHKISCYAFFCSAEQYLFWRENKTILRKRFNQYIHWTNLLFIRIGIVNDSFSNGILLILPTLSIVYTLIKENTVLKMSESNNSSHSLFLHFSHSSIVVRMTFIAWLKREWEMDTNAIENLCCFI